MALRISPEGLLGENTLMNLNLNKQSIAKKTNHGKYAKCISHKWNENWWFLSYRKS